MKTFYENPEMEIIRFEIEDVITTSGGWDSDVGGNDDKTWGEVM